MSLQNSTRIIQYVGNGVTTSFPIPFAFHADSDIVAHKETIATGISETLALATDYVLEGVNNPAGGTIIILGLTLTNEYRLTVQRIVPIEQLTDYINNDSFEAEAHERQMDLLAMAVQQVNDRKVLAFPANELLANSTELPSATDRLGTLLHFNETTGEPEVKTADEVLGVVVADVVANAAAASASASEASASASEASASASAASVSAADAAASAVLADVTNASVNAAIATDKPASRTALDLGYLPDTYSINFGGVNYAAVDPGPTESDITVAHVVSGVGSSVLSVGVTGRNITVTAGSTTTNAAVAAAVNASGPALALVTATPYGSFTAFYAKAATNLTAPLSTIGGANKIPRFGADGNLVTGLWSDPSNSAANRNLEGVGNVFIPDMQGVRWLTSTGTISGANIRMWENHDGVAGELIIESPWRTAFLQPGPIQVGLNDGGKYIRQIQMVSGSANDASTPTQNMPSGAISFQTSAWNGSAPVFEMISMQAHALDATGANSVLRFWDQSSVYLQDGGGNVYTENKGHVVGNLIAEFHDDGLWTKGTAPTFEPLQDGATITQTCIKHRAIQVGKVTLGGNRTLALSGLLPGMRGTIYVSQPASGGPHTLTPSGGSALDLSTAANATDRVQWELDGVFTNFTVTKAIQREAVVSDADAIAFIAAASITDAIQKAAISGLVEGLKAASIWTKGVAIYPFVGGTSAKHAVNLKTPGTYNITDDASWQAATHNANGVTGAGTAYGKTGLIPANAGTQNSLSLSFYSRTVLPTTNSYIIGTATDTESASILHNNPGTEYVAVNGLNDGTALSMLKTTSSDWRTQVTASRTGANSQFLRAYGNATTNANASSGLPTGQFYILAMQYNGVAYYHSNINLAFAWIGAGITQGEAITLDALVTAFQTTLGRQNP